VAEDLLELEKELSEEQTKKLLEAGVHYGQPLSRRCPRMDRFVYGVTSGGIQVIDLNSTWESLTKAFDLLKKLSKENKNTVFIGTNPRAVSSVLTKLSAEYGLSHVCNRWLGGILTNPELRRRINDLRELEAMLESGFMDSIASSKEKSVLSKKRKKLNRSLGGLKNIKSTIHGIVIIDPAYEINATLEAIKKKKNIFTIAVADTNCRFDPSLFDIIVPCNLSSLGSIEEVLRVLARAVKEGKEERKESTLKPERAPLPLKNSKKEKNRKSGITKIASSKETNFGSTNAVTSLKKPKQI